MDERIRLYGDHDEQTKAQIERVAEHYAVRRAAVLADGHVGYAFPIGGVAAYAEHISLSGVGYDIGCGNKAVCLDIPAKEVRRKIKTIMDDLWNTISFGIGRRNEELVDHEVFEGPDWKLPATKPLKQMAQNQLGTVGSGNHFVNIMEDEKERVWIAVHFGSRGLGHKITTWFMEQAGASDDMMSAPTVFHERSALGEDYIQAMNLGLRYAYAGRDWVCDRVAKILKANIVDSVHNNHNFAQIEQHFGEKLWVVRKGSTPAFPGQRGFIGSSMAEESLIVEGVRSPLAEEMMHSTVHGAGRALSRSAARGARHRKTGELYRDEHGRIKRPPLVTREMMDEWVGKSGVELRGADVDESPHCYKRLSEVIRHHEGTIKVLHRLKPLGVAMAGEKEFDPYKD
jgi:tRNA-splicing ligase RtcB (3'-phosphate/5'-hydroxy nucleic acid ligase)